MPQHPVTVIIPAYNAAKYLIETVQSAHSARPERILIVNDGSTDETLEIAHKLASTLDCVEVLSQTNSGESAAINAGLSQNRSEYVLFLSADDLISENLLSAATRELEKDPSLVAAYPSWNKIDSHGKVLGEVSDISFSYERLIGNLECLPGPGSVIRAKSLGVGRLEKLTQMGDFEQWIRISAKGKLVHLNEVLASWRQHTNNMSLKSFGVKNSTELEIIRIQAELTLEELSLASDKRLRARFLATWHKMKAISEVRVPGSYKSVGHLVKSLSILASDREVKLGSPWTLIEILGCLIPVVSGAWLSVVKRFGFRK
jgi:glycosyltransferase involved in cell wall biosynthesis